MAKIKNAILYAKVEPSEAQEEKINKFLTAKYGEVNLTFIEVNNIDKGFILEVGSDIYDWTTKGLLSQFDREIHNIDSSKNIISIIREKAANFKLKVVPQQLGVVVRVKDSIATIRGLDQVKYAEIVVFNSGIKGMILNIDKDCSEAILFGDASLVSEGMTVYRTNKEAGVGVSDMMLGRVVDSLGSPIDGLGNIEVDSYLPIENSAPSIIERGSVNRPLETGILTIDSMFPIGKGQRELIIGDRQTGKTSLILDTILNQRGKDVICIYVAIGQKASNVALLVETLRKNKALDYSIIVASFASDPSSLQYIAPYSAMAIAEYFMYKGKDVLICLDDLSRHAISYRTISLLLGRAPGREAYPGDVFYLHSRLLERAAQLNQNLGGGSITALPIVETEASDVSAYIPTNVISITDGQIFLESDLFKSGQRPAINIGLSVSRVGSSAQTKAIKKATSSLRLDLSQYREIEVFSQFASELDDLTKVQLRHGNSLMYLLRQGLHKPYEQYEETILLIAANHKLFIDVPTKLITKCKDELLRYFNFNKANICQKIASDKDYSKELEDEIINISSTFISSFLGDNHE